MNANPCFITVTCKDKTTARIRADEITTLLERNTDQGLLVTIPTKAKTLETMHTMKDIWIALEDAIGGSRARTVVVPYAPFPAENVAPISNAKRAAKA